VREQLLAVVVAMASRGLRCICLAQTDIAAAEKGRPSDFFENADNVDQAMTAVAIVGIKDPVRAEVGRLEGPGRSAAAAWAGAAAA
jgi:Ca2+-transporting ATPase